MRIRVATLMLVALIMWRIKRYYADANVDDLQWILGPTARLVTAVTTTPFQWEAGEGYLSRERMFLIEKACAGINFMIAAFGMVAFVLRRRMCGALTGAAVIAITTTTSATPPTRSPSADPRRRRANPARSGSATASPSASASTTA